MNQDEVVNYRIAGSVLQDIVKVSLRGDERFRVLSGGGLKRARGVEVEVEEGSCRVHLPIDARFGEDLLALGGEVQERVADSLRHMTGLEVEAVDVVIAGVYPRGEE